jgi:hypothetical protein
MQFCPEFPPALLISSALNFPDITSKICTVAIFVACNIKENVSNKIYGYLCL